MSGSSAASLCLVFNELLAIRGADAQTKVRRPCLAKARLGALSHCSDNSLGPPGASPASRLQHKEAAGKEGDKPRDWEHTDFRMETALQGALGDAV